MAKNTSFSLGAHHEAFIEAQIRSGRYHNASEVVRTALRQLEDHETELRALREALDEGERSGEPTEFDFESFRAGKRAQEPGSR